MYFLCWDAVVEDVSEVALGSIGRDGCVSKRSSNGEF